MRTHTVEGQRMLDNVGGAITEVGWIVRASHDPTVVEALLSVIGVEPADERLAA
jgi:hypothetical protein